ncbi:MAG: chemotaxis protein CheX [Paraglaciecola sp.]|jgi:chemotaxis protein CheX
MNVEFINPFITALVNVVGMMGHTELTSEKPQIKNNVVSMGDISGLIGMVGPKTKGSLSITFEKSLALRIMQRMLGERKKEIDEEVIDMVGEMTNMVSGGAKTELSKKGYEFDMATPMIVSGTNHSIDHIHDGHVIIIPFNSDSGKAFIEICFD